MYVAKTKALISFAVTAKLICVFVFAYANRWFSHDAAHFFSSSLYWALRRKREVEGRLIWSMPNVSMALTWL